MSLEIRDVLFFALLPDPDAGKVIADLAKSLRLDFGSSGSLVPEERLHISLNRVGSFCGGLPEDIVSAARQAAEIIRTPPFEVIFDRRFNFKNADRHALVLTCGQGAASVVKLYEDLDKALKHVGLGARGRLPKLNPHITLLRDPDPFVAGPLDEPIAWVVTEFVLVHSLHGLGRHEHLARWPLRIK